MPASVAHTRRNSTKSPAPDKQSVARNDMSQGRFLRLLQKVTLTLIILGTLLVSGIARPRIPGLATAVRSAGVTVAAPATSALAVRSQGNCPPLSGPCV